MILKKRHGVDLPLIKELLLIKKNCVGPKSLDILAVKNVLYMKQIIMVNGVMRIIIGVVFHPIVILMSKIKINK